MAVGAAVGLLVYGAIRGFREAVRQAADGWRSLAELRHEEIESLERRVATLEAEHRRLMAENEQLRSLNLRYQAEIVELRARVAELEMLLRRGSE